MPHAASDALHRRVRAFIAGVEHDTFDRLACDIARFQALRVPSIGRLMSARGVDPETLVKASQIPPLPSEAFRHRRIAAHEPSSDQRCFVTSGTSGGNARSPQPQRGKHPMRSIATYQAGALLWAQHMLWPDRDDLRVIALLQSECKAPHSSLSFMVGRFVERLGSVDYFFDGDTVNLGRLQSCLAELDQPALVVGTGFAFVHFCDALRRPLRLPEGSRVMQTGGFKGRSRVVDKHELRQALATSLGLNQALVVGEYGMTELSSQLYEGSLRAHLGLPVGDPTRYWPPPWLRVRAVDPVTLKALPAGEIGIARFVDLANVDSAVAIQTADQISCDDDGSISLLGRLPGAPPRGCSLALEHLLDVS